MSAVRDVVLGNKISTTKRVKSYNIQNSPNHSEKQSRQTKANSYSFHNQNGDCKQTQMT